MSAPIKILFVCGRNNRRSPSAEKIFKTSKKMEVRSAGTSDNSRRKVNAADLAWADLALVMERKHASRIRDMFGHLEKLPPMESLDIEDDYIFMQLELVEMIKAGVATAIENYRLEQEGGDEE